MPDAHGVAASRVAVRVLDLARAKFAGMKLTPEKLTAFCAVLAETCNVSKACKAVDISRMTAYNWREEMPEFKTAWDRAMKAGVLGLEDEAHRRAFEGVKEPLTHQGQFTYLYRKRVDNDGNPVLDVNGDPIHDPVLDEYGEHQIASVRKYSDTLTIFLLKAHDPEKYRENSSINLNAKVSVNELTDDDIRNELAMLVGAGIAAGGTGDDDVSDLL